MAIKAIPAGDALAALLGLADGPSSDSSTVVMLDTDLGEVMVLTGDDAAAYRELLQPDDTPRIRSHNWAFFERYRQQI